METIVKRIDDILEQLKICAYGRTLPSGNESGCNPAHFASCAKKFFAEIHELEKQYPNLWKSREDFFVYDCERLSEHHLAVASCKSCKDAERIVLDYLNQFSRIVDMIHRNLNM